MKINKNELRTLWYEDENGNVIPHDSEACEAPKGAAYQVSQFPNELRTTYLELIRQEDVDQCTHPRKFIRPTYGWVDGVVGRECTRCGGHQVKHKWHFWPKKWDASGSRKAFESTTHYGGTDVILAMINSGDYTFNEAIIAYATACERCMNVLAQKYTGKDGYEEFSDEWMKANTVCGDISRTEAIEQNQLWKERQSGKDTTTHLCNSCQKSYPTCDNGSDGVDFFFGNGRGNDNIYRCKAYIPEVKTDATEHKDTPVRRKPRSKRVPAVQELQENCTDGTTGEQLDTTKGVNS